MDTQQTPKTQYFGEPPRRPLWDSLLRGWMGRCPECGEGRMFGKYLKILDECPACGLRLDGHQADDAPPYFTIFVVGHLLVPLMLVYEVMYKPSLAMVLSIGITATILLALALLPRIKGALVGLQWAKYMHGFGVEPEIGTANPL